MLDAASQPGPRNTCNKMFYHKLIHGFARAGSPDGACWVVERMVRSGMQPNAVTFNTVMDACAKAADPARAAF
eukprot:4605191-Pyramimonas_sp.AAC.1